jgi:hypothetical protein
MSLPLQLKKPIAPDNASSICSTVDNPPEVEEEEEEEADTTNPENCWTESKRISLLQA